MKLMFPDLAGHSSTLCQAAPIDVPLELEEDFLSPHSEVDLSAPLSADQYNSFMDLAKSLGLKKFAPNVFSEPVNSDRDPYLLVLLAEQDLGAGRKEQAICLLEAAFSAFDQNAVDHRMTLTD